MFQIDKSSGVQSAITRSGKGCPVVRDGNPQHNPRPTTERGKRRHANRSEAKKAIAEKAWNTDRSTRPSRYQERMKSRTQLQWAQYGGDDTGAGVLRGQGTEIKVGSSVAIR